MKLVEMLGMVLERIRSQHYADRQDAYWRDHRALTRALARYGYECIQRGWQLDTEDILRDLLAVLDTMRGRDEEIRIWFPRYLEAAIDRHVRLRAEEIQDRSRGVTKRVEDTVRGLKVGELREPTVCETLGKLYKDLRKRPAGHVPRARKDRAQQSFF